VPPHGEPDAVAAPQPVESGVVLYPVLARLEADGLVRSQWREGDGGPGRKYFAITADGRTELDRRVTRWQAFCRLTTDLLEGQARKEGSEVPT
jgi:PadR family transcriptional regulator, regulatory protein PadR